MKVVITHTIKKKEFRRGDLMEKNLQVILKGFKKGIFDTIRGLQLPVNSRLIKVYATTVYGARRIVYLVDMENGDGFLLFYRDKKDRIGKNISLQNPYFKTALTEHLILLHKDLTNGLYDEYEL
ncbi:hypothetical protein IT413_01240 [Candidatus Peregrinibacteria bacterium]|nr:hypothetical protein [Candidatus Peregrinibacteria bacterium]